MSHQLKQCFEGILYLHLNGVKSTVGTWMSRRTDKYVCCLYLLDPTLWLTFGWTTFQYGCISCPDLFTRRLSSKFITNHCKDKNMQNIIELNSMRLGGPAHGIASKTTQNSARVTFFCVKLGLVQLFPVRSLPNLQDK